MSFLFYALFALVPIVLWPKTSEVFEFNKIVLVYILTTLIMAAWVIRSCLAKKFIFRRTILDIPLLIFLTFQLISFSFSIDPRTSFFGYYSRFNGGLLSTICFLLLYWAFVSNMDRAKTIKSIYFLLTSAILVSLYAVLEHFGIDKNVWVQDVQTRVFSTLGQPNWLAAWLVAIIPITWALALKTKYWLWVGLSTLFSLTILYTKSRSGIIGFAFAFGIFWSTAAWFFKDDLKNLLKKFLLFTSPLLLITTIVGSPWSPNLTGLANRQPTVTNPQPAAPALEVGGTESATIREIVWKGAVEIWKHYPILGTGPETFAFSYYLYRPVEHNLVSEWDFLYNKAHNEYLNYLANTGVLGLGSYLILIAFAIYQITRTSNKYQLDIGLLSGYVSILVTNFSGFSVVPIQILFFLFPAIAVGLTNNQPTTNNYQLQKFSNNQKVLLLAVVGCMLYVVFGIAKYWYADTLYAKGIAYNGAQKFVDAQKYLSSTINYSPDEPLFHDALSQADAGIALALDANKAHDKALPFIQMAISESGRATSLSPANLNLKRNRAGIFIKLAIIDRKYLGLAKEVLIEATQMAPTDAKLLYNLGLVYARTGEGNLAIKTLEKTVQLKSNYRDARLALAYIYIEKKDFTSAATQLKYILEKIDPNDSISKNQLEEISR